MATVSKRIAEAVFRQYGRQCFYCDRDWQSVTLTIDHVRPRAAGGRNIPGQLVPACHQCNSAKGATWDPSRWFRGCRVGFYPTMQPRGA